MISYSTYNDQELTALLQEGDYAAFTEIYQRYWEKLMTAAGKRVGSREIAEELVQDIFLSLFLRRKEIQIQSHVEAYLMAALKHQVFKVYRSLKTHERYVDASMALPAEQPIMPDALMEAKQLREQIYAVAEKMPDKCREVFLLSRFDQLSHKDIAEKLNISVNTVKRHINKAIAILHKEFKDQQLEIIAVGIFLFFVK